MRSLFAAGLWLALAPGAAVVAAPAHPEVAYGPDDRIEVGKLTGARARNAAATVALVQTGQIRANGNGTSTLISPSLGNYLNLCPDQRFRTQPTAADCTGFLARPDLVVTAGHCVDSGNLSGTRFVFGYRMVDGTARTTIANSRIYRGTRIVARKLTSVEDYAVVRLDRTVPGRTPVPIQTASAIPLSTPVYVIGHPTGLPAKFSGNARVQGNGSPFYVRTNLDTFGGNSGSPVFNAGNDKVIGILVRGAPDYRARGSCEVVNTLPNNAGEEEATRISLVRPFLGTAP
jgi:V8-like Glu-specific endopeptidase